MKTILATALAGSFTLVLAIAAHAEPAQIPTPVNPYPINAVATDGSPLPSQSNAVRSGGYANNGGFAGNGASPFNFVGNFAGAGLDSVGGALGVGGAGSYAR